MSQPKELEWNRLFAYDLPPEVEAPAVKRCTCGNHTCQTAKRIRCTCRCHSENHGIEQRRGMQPLDKALGLEKTEQAPVYIS